MKHSRIAFIAALAAAFFLLMAPAIAQSIAQPRPACYPLVNGYPVGMPQQRTGSVGLHVFWFCSDSKGGPPRAEGISCIKSQCSEILAGEALAAVTRASAKVGTANSLWDQHVQFNCPDVEKETTARGRLCRERKAILQANKAAWGVP